MQLAPLHPGVMDFYVAPDLAGMLEPAFPKFLDAHGISSRDGATLGAFSRAWLRRLAARVLPKP
jgi:hypothetical protein